MMEGNLRRALLLAEGDWSTFLTRPICAFLLALSLALLVIVGLPAVRQTRQDAFKED